MSHWESKFVNIATRDVDFKSCATGHVHDLNSRVQREIHKMEAITERQGLARRLLKNDKNVVRKSSAA